MEEAKQKILGDLYAIRATMSMVAENDDSAQPERQAIADLKSEGRRDQYALEESKKAITDWLQDDIKRNKEYLKKPKEYYESDKEYIDHSFIYHFWKTLWDSLYTYAVLGIILVILIIASVGVSFGCGSLWSELDYWQDEEEFWYGVLYTAIICFSCIIAYLLCICVPFTVLERRSYMKSAEKYKMKIQEGEQELREENELYEAIREKSAAEADFWHSICQKTNASERLAPRLIQMIQQHEERIIDTENKMQKGEEQKNLHNKAITTIAQQSQAIIESAVKAYPLIDFRDWENVDLLIYYFETGRADDMKEALQLVDRQRQTDQLAEAIEVASESICKTINRSMAQLGSALAQSFSVLSSQLATQHIEMMQGLAEQAAAIERQSALQVSAQTMNAALLNKISDSSTDLAEQMDRQMKEVYHIYY